LDFKVFPFFSTPTLACRALRSFTIMEQWATSSNSALRLTLLDAPNLKSDTFHPTFTYPIFGEAETIYGYSNLQLPLQLKSDTLLSALDVKYDRKLESKTAKIDDPRASLMEFLPAGDVHASLQELEEKAGASSSNSNYTPFKPLGQLVHTYARAKESKGKGKGRAGGPRLHVEVDDPNARRFEIYHCDWNTPSFREYHRRMQFFTLLFIEGASYLKEDEGNWEFLVLYEVSQAPQDGEQRYHFMGYTSVYSYWYYPNLTRLRLSQFIILPPYQAQGHGAELYNETMKLALNRESVTELTIEDPSEAFDKLRDTNDLKRLLSPEDGFLKRAKEHVKGGALRAPIDRVWSEMERRTHKIVKRQWDRLLEMTQLMMLDEEDVEQVKKYRLQVSGAC
jgi:histone acetyltransferase 1